MSSVLLSTISVFLIRGRACEEDRFSLFCVSWVLISTSHALPHASHCLRLHILGTLFWRRHTLEKQQTLTVEVFFQ